MANVLDEIDARAKELQQRTAAVLAQLRTAMNPIKGAAESYPMPSPGCQHLR
jgi:hypothetical protein